MEIKNKIQYNRKRNSGEARLFPIKSLTTMRREKDAP
jgi:hypothetical protein